MKDPKCEHASLSASERSGDHLLRWLVAKYLRVARYAQSCRWPLTANEEMQLYTSIPQSGSSLLPVLDTIKHIHKIQRGFYHACLFTLCFTYNASNLTTNVTQNHPAVYALSHANEAPLTPLAARPVSCSAMHAEEERSE